jgi:diguanylate cyclase (GGDEF)-like protein/PAS domain S-box-containing protein
MLDDQGRLVHWNRRLEEASGYSAEELKGKLALELIDEDSRSNIAERILQVFADGEASAEAEIQTKQGKVTPYRFSSRRTFLEGKAYLVGLGEDITERKQIELALRESEMKYRLLFENTDARIVIFDADGIILMINESNARMMGGTPADFIGRSMYDLVPEGTAGLYRQRFEQIIREERSGIFEDPYILPDGEHWFSSQIEPVADASGNVYGIQLVAVDITRRRHMENALRESEALWKFALEGAGDAVWDLDVPNNRCKYSARWQEMLGYAADEIVDDLDDWVIRLHPDDMAVVAASRALLLDGGTETSSDEVRMRCKNGSWKWILSRGMIVSRDESGMPLRIIGTCTDITLLKEHQHQLEHVAHYDALTNLPNRMLLGFHLQQSMAQCQRRNQSLAVAYLDLDGFKAVNDRYGHGVGDELLVLVAQRMKAALRECDTLARIGGDEFVAVLADLDRLQDCEPVFERLLLAAAAPARVGEIDLQVSASIGVTIYPKDGVDADQLMRHADQAMYQAKQAGRNRYHLFDIEHDAAVQIQRESIEHIRNALDRREFVLHYQPKVNMQSGALIGVEALIRWQHPQRGLLSPDAFLPVIEDQQISVSLGEWVIDTALTQMEEWLAAGLDIPVSVNISAYHLQQDNFEAQLAELLAAHPGVNPAHLELEILETSALGDVMQVSELMHACRAFGVTFALDDFGTGYSSLTYLRRLPVELLKIDQSFVRSMLDDPDDLAIVEGVVGLAVAFRRKVIAEGVETVAHGELLLQLGCELAQGYGIARPMPAAELPDWAANWRPDSRWMTWRERPLNCVTFPRPSLN